jgi:hypothetical protein
MRPPRSLAATFTPSAASQALQIGRNFQRGGKFQLTDQLAFAAQTAGIKTNGSAGLLVSCLAIFLFSTLNSRAFAGSIFGPICGLHSLEQIEALSLKCLQQLEWSVEVKFTLGYLICTWVVF